MLHKNIYYLESLSGLLPNSEINFDISSLYYFIEETYEFYFSYSHFQFNSLNSFNSYYNFSYNYYCSLSFNSYNYISFFFLYFL